MAIMYFVSVLLMRWRYVWYYEGIDCNDYFDYEETEIDNFIKVCTVNEKLIISNRLSNILELRKRAKRIGVLQLLTVH